MSDQIKEIVYLSWGGTGRASALHEAMGRADGESAVLVYLAILDDSTFGDIDPSLRDLAKDELSWLLDAQLELARRQTGREDTAVRLLVRSGDVAGHVVEVVDTIGAEEVLVGAPLPDDGDNAVTDLLAVLKERLDVPVSVIEP